MGLPRADRPRLFEPFYRGEQGPRHTVGTGHGARDYPRAARGGARPRVGRESSRRRRQVLDSGSGAKPPRARGVGRTMTRPARILLVDDETSIQKRADAAAGVARLRRRERDDRPRGAAGVRAGAGRPDRPGPWPAGSRRRRSVPAPAGLVAGADHRAVGARRGCRQDCGARSGRRRLRHEALQPRGAARENPRGAAPGLRCHRTGDRPRPARRPDDRLRSPSRARRRAGKSG